MNTNDRIKVLRSSILNDHELHSLAAWGLRFLAVVLVASATAMTPARAELRFAGVNLAGGEFGDVGGEYNRDYVYPNQKEVDYFKRRGMNILRVCFRWERLQPVVNSEFNATEFGRLNGFVSQATAKDMYVILDPHNYGRHGGHTIGSPEVPQTAFADFWSRLATSYRTNQHVIFGLMNEPHDMSTNKLYSTETWRDAAQGAVNAIRSAGARNLILIPGNAWTGAHSWLQNWYGTPNGTAMLSLTDPLTNFAFEVHQYLDSDSSGTSPGIVSTNIGAERLASFTQWCRTHHRRAFLGEFAVANSTMGDGIGDEAISNMLTHVQVNSDVWLGWTWWAAGPWWGSYMFSLEPTGNFTVDQPAMARLREFLPAPRPALGTTRQGEFRFSTWPGFLYQPLFAADLLAGGWAELGSNLLGNGQTAIVMMPTGEVSGFFRVRVGLGP